MDLTMADDLPFVELGNPRNMNAHTRTLNFTEFTGNTEFANKSATKNNTIGGGQRPLIGAGWIARRHSGEWASIVNMGDSRVPGRWFYNWGRRVIRDPQKAALRGLITH
jgi:hypothetical protein